MNNNIKHNTLMDSKRKVVAMLASLVLLAVISVGTTLAFMKMNANSLTNTFTAASEEQPEINENFRQGDLTKSDVKVDVGTPGYGVYVRAKVLINWSDSNGKVLAVTPPVEGTDYTISINESDWDDGGDGYWYYKQPISNGVTNNLIETCTVNREAPVSGYTLQVDILAQTIQAVGETDAGVAAVTDAWGATVHADKTISK